MRLKDVTTLADQDADPSGSTNTISDLDDFNFNIIDEALLPLLTKSDPLPDLQQRCS